MKESSTLIPMSDIASTQLNTHKLDMQLQACGLKASLYPTGES